MARYIVIPNDNRKQYIAKFKFKVQDTIDKCVIAYVHTEELGKHLAKQMNSKGYIEHEDLKR